MKTKNEKNGYFLFIYRNKIVYIDIKNATSRTTYNNR